MPQSTSHVRLTPCYRFKKVEREIDEEIVAHLYSIVRFLLPNLEGADKVATDYPKVSPWPRIMFVVFVFSSLAIVKVPSDVAPT